MQKILFALLLLCITVTVNAQWDNQIDNGRRYRREIMDDSAIADKTAMGIGLGFDYGGVGVGAAVYTGNNFGFIGGVGYAITGVGFNAGIKYRFFNYKPRGVVPFIVAMYGYNAAVKLSYDDANGIMHDVNKVFYGPSFGVGIDTKYRPGKQGYWSFSILGTIRSQAYHDAINGYKNAGGTFSFEPTPVSFSVGYKWVID